MRKIITLFLAIVCAAVSLRAQQELPNDPETRVGRLENGMTYYIRHNGLPAQRCEFYLATDVGAIQEAPDQDGLAHFLEHMCFNGTKNFPGKGILNWLESIGASFGGNVNASTGVEHTQYMLNNIPLSRPGVLDTCILIMHDYSHFVLCEPEEIDAERGVILEEKRTRNTASWRLMEASMPYIYGNTKYNGCNIIGSEENLKTFKPESLTNFYHTWYIPCNQALIVVGDIDVDEVEAKIKDTFADIPAPESPKAKDVILIPDNAEPIVGILTDPELNQTSVTVYWKNEPMPRELRSTAVGLMTDIVKDIITNVMDERLQDISAKADSPWIAAGTAIGELTTTCEAVFAQVAAKDGEAASSLGALLVEMQKMQKFGFTEAEVERAKSKILAVYESRANKADTRKNAEFIRPFLANFFNGESFMDPKMEYEFVKMVMPQLQSAMVNQVCQGIIGPKNMIVIYNAPESGNHPTEEQLRAVIAEAENAEIAQAEGEEIPSEFLDPAKLRGSKVKKITDYIYGSRKLTLANGLDVILLPTDHEKDKISFDLILPGGQSLASDEDLYNIEDNIWGLYLQNTGIAQYPATMVTKMCAGKNFSGQPYINAYTHGIEGVSTPKDLETALQCVYLMFTQPRFDSDEYNQGMKIIQSILPNLASQPDYQLQGKLYKVIYKSPRRFNISEESVSKASLEGLEKVYRSLFKDTAGATAIIVGDFDPDEITPLVQKYLGSLPKGKKAAVASYRGDGIAEGSEVCDFSTKMQTPKTTVLQAYSYSAPYSVENEVLNSAVSYIMNMVYTETLREEEGGTYGASVSARTPRDIHPVALLQVYFDTNAEQADALRELAKAGLVKLATEGPTPEQFEKTVRNLEKKIPEAKIRNAIWSMAIETYVRYGIEYIPEYEAAVAALTPEKIKAAAAAFAAADLKEIVMRPEQ